MKIVRNDSESLVCQVIVPRIVRIAFLIWFGGFVILCTGLALWLKAGITLIPLAFSIVAPFVFYAFFPMEKTLVFAKQSQRLLLIYKFAWRQTQKEIDYDQIQDVRIKKKFDFKILSLVFEKEPELPVYSYTNRSELARIEEDAELLRDALRLQDREVLGV